MATEPVILVGLRLQDDYRRRNWSFARSRWLQQLGWPIYEGYDEGPGPFSMARASNRAAAVGDWQMAFYVGADFLIATAAQAAAAVERARETGQLTFAHSHLTHLAESETAQLIAAGPSTQPHSDERRQPNTFSGALAIPRALWEQVGGFDERFAGWGYEDLAFWSACTALAGNYQRVDGDAFHLWHPRSRADNEENPNHAANQILGERYMAARNNFDATQAILDERGS